MGIKGILFDFDGTLANSMKGHFLAWRSAFSDYAVNIKEEDYYPLEGKHLLEIAEIISEKYGVDKSEAKNIRDLKINYSKKGEDVNLYGGVEEFISLLEARDIKRGIVTASVGSFLEKKVDKEFLERFDVILTSDMYERGKPEPDPYLRGIKELGLSVGECIAVENAPLGIKSAKAAGMYCIAIGTTLGKKYLREADVIVSDFSEIFNLEILKDLKSN